MIVTERIQTTIRSTRRLAEILAVLHRHGFGGFVLATGLGRLAGREPTPSSDDETPGDATPVPVRLRMALEELGPTFSSWARSSAPAAT